MVRSKLRTLSGGFIYSYLPPYLYGVLHFLYYLLNRLPQLWKRTGEVAVIKTDLLKGLSLLDSLNLEKDGE